MRQRPLPAAVLTAVATFAGLATAGRAQTPAVAPSLTTRLDALCQTAIDAELTVGIAVGLLDGDTMLVRGYGAVARGGARPDGDTVFEIGSISKVFTGLLLADAVQRGEARLDDPLQKLLPAGTVVPRWEEREVLLWHLATHTSGLPRLPDMKGGDPADPYAHFDEPRLLAALAKARVRWEPGSTYEYSNLAVGVLGLALAHRSGAPSYGELLRQRITAPLGMADTMVQLDDAHRARFATPHDTDGAPVHAWDLAALAGAGGIRSTVRDMLRFLTLQRAPGESPLAAAVALQQKKHHDGKDGIALGLGWHFARDGITLWHNGGTGGFHAYAAVVPSTGRAVCLLANTDWAGLDQLGERVLQLAHGRPVAPLPFEVPVAVDRAALQRLVGEYRLDERHRIAVTLDERGLHARLTGQPPVRLFARSATEFAIRAADASVTFTPGGAEASALVLHQDGKDQRAERVPAK